MSFENFKQIVLARITQHQQAKLEELETERKAIRIQEEAKAKAKADAEIAKSKAEQEADRIAYVKELARTDALDKAIEKEQAEAAAIVERRKQVQIASQLRPVKVERPSDKDIIAAISEKFGVSTGTACDWVFAVAEAMGQAA